MGSSPGYGRKDADSVAVLKRVLQIRMHAVNEDDLGVFWWNAKIVD
jgi:hypothetical protein